MCVPQHLQRSKVNLMSVLVFFLYWDRISCLFVTVYTVTLVAGDLTTLILSKEQHYCAQICGNSGDLYLGPHAYRPCMYPQSPTNTYRSFDNTFSNKIHEYITWSSMHLEFNRLGLKHSWKNREQFIPGCHTAKPTRIGLSGQPLQHGSLTVGQASMYSVGNRQKRRK